MENAHGLIVGVANFLYARDLPDIVLKDAEDVKNILVDESYCCYPTNNVRLLKNQEATKSSILDQLSLIARRCDHESVVFIFISSHGEQIGEGKYKGEYLLTYNTQISSEKEFAETAISSTEFTQALREIPARKLVVVFDCCHSGGIGQPKALSKSQLKIGLSEDYYKLLAMGRGRVILASSRDTELSWINSGDENSLFTKHLINGLRGGAPSDRGVIRIFDLFNYIQPRVTAERSSQHPIFKAELEENFSVALYQGGKITPSKENIENEEHDTSTLKIAEAYPALLETKSVQVIISQLFRMTDFLIYPKSVREKRFYNAITNPSTCRRVYNRASGFKIEPYGYLNPVVSITGDTNIFWKKALPDFREADSICFIPFELDLSERIRKLQAKPKSILENAIRGKSRVVQNIQISGHLRIYPPGTGVVRIKMALEFKDGVQIETVSKLAHEVESLYFIDTKGEEISGGELFIEIIDRVSDTFFKREGSTNFDRRWNPPETIYIFKDYQGDIHDTRIKDLARLLAYSPSNEERIDFLKTRVKAALNSPHWKYQRVFFVTGQNAAIVILPKTTSKGKKEKIKEELDGFSDTHDLVTSALYTEKAFAERIDRIYTLRQMDETWLPEQGEKFTDLFSLIQVTHRVIQAINSIFPEIRNQGKGELMNFAKDLWIYNNEIDFPQFRQGLTYIANWLNDSEKNQQKELVILAKAIDRILQIPQPFEGEIVKPVSVIKPEFQETLEKQILSGIERLEEMQDQDMSEKEVETITRKIVRAKNKLNDS